MDQSKVFNFLKNKFKAVIICAAKVGGIHANNGLGQFYISEFMYTNNLILVLIKVVSKFNFLGSSCVYPRDCNQPILEKYL